MTELDFPAYNSTIIVLPEHYPPTGRRAETMKKLVIEKSAVKKNLSVIKERAGKSAVYAVVAGMPGMADMARLLR